MDVGVPQVGCASSMRQKLPKGAYPCKYVSALAIPTAALRQKKGQLSLSFFGGLVALQREDYRL